MRNIAQGKKRIIKRILQVILIAVIFYFLARNLYINWNKIAEYNWRINYYFLVFSWLLSVGGGFLIALGWNLILRVLGGRLSHKRALKIFFVTDLAKYIPGKVWTMVGKVYMCKEEGVPVAVTSTSVVIQPLIQVISGLLIFLLSLPFWTKTSDFMNNLYLFFLLIPLGLLLLHPAIMTRPLNFVLRKLKQKPIELKIKYSHILSILLLWCGLWVLTGITYYFLIISVHPFPLLNLPVTIGIFAIAGVSQFLTPSGIGVLEGMLTVLLGLYFPIPVAILIALLVRVWKTVSELVCVAITVKF